MKLKVFISTVGCRANQADSDDLVRGLDPAKTTVVSKMEAADVVVVNTCCVTREAERDCRKIARRAAQHESVQKVVFTGCAVTAFDDFGVGVDDKVERRGGGDCPPTELSHWLNQQNEVTGTDAAVDRPLETTGRSRAILKIQTGCNHGCSYCIVPKARGPESSLPPEQVLERVRALKDEGFSEIVISGVQLGAWGSDLAGSLQLPDIVQSMADAFEGGRLRLSSIEPWSVDARLIDLVARHPAICPHLHVPLQSGDNRVLSGMRRGYNVADYLEIVQRAKSKIPDLAWGTDMLFGFPGEDEQAFKNTMAALKEIEPSYLHAFPYSPRPGTIAAKMTGAPARSVAKERVFLARAFGDQATRRFKQRQSGLVRQVIVEESRGAALRSLTDNYLTVSLPPIELKPRALMDVKLRYQATDDQLAGELIESR